MPKLPLAQSPPPSRQGGDVDDLLEAALDRARYRRGERARLLKTPGAASSMLEDDEQMWRVLQDNKHLDFVRRALNPDQYPTITDDPRLKEGYGASHQMGWTTMESGPLKGKHIAYPNILYDRRSGSLSWPDPKQALRAAVEAGEYIEFDTPEKAAQFASKYKRGTSIR